jgi:hypothetical protein
VGIAVGGLLAIAIGALIAVALSGTREAAQASATPSPSGSIAASASLGPTDSPEPTEVPSPTAVAIPVIPNRGIAFVTTDVLTFRAGPGESARAYGELGAGVRLFVIGTPEEEGDLRWYRMAYISGPIVSGFGLGTGCELQCGPDIGWAATPLTGEERRLSEGEADCPASPMTVDQLATLAPLERLHCYGRQDITATGTLDSCFCEDQGSSVFEPAWLGSPPRRFVDGFLGLHVSPDSGLPLPEPESTIRFTGHFEDAAAPSCRVDFSDPAIAGSYDGPTGAVLVLTCRTALVITDYEVVPGP